MTRSAIRDQYAFNPDMMKFVLEVAHFSAFRDFYFGIFCHSAWGELAERFTNQFTALLSHGKREFVRWLIDHWATHILPIYESCSTRPVLQSVLSVMNQMIEDDSDEVNELMHFHIATSDRCRTDIFPDLCGMLRDFLSASPKRVQFAQSKNWLALLNDVIDNKYGGTADVKRDRRSASIVDLLAILSHSDSTFALLPNFRVGLGQT
jgi:hypothetical protein